MSYRQRTLMIILLVFVAMLGSAIMLVYTKHQSRKLYVEVRKLQSEIDGLNTEWGQLQLEQSTWSDHGRVEQIARTKLSMAMPDPDDVVFIKP